MLTAKDALFIGQCLQGFFYGKISLPFTLTLTLQVAKAVQLFPGLGIYTGIFIIYLKCSSKNSRTTTILFYALCFLYVLSTVVIAIDLVTFIIEVSINCICKIFFFFNSVVQSKFHTLSPQLQTVIQRMIFAVTYVQDIASGFCDLIAQCIIVRINHCTYLFESSFYSPSSSKIYRCWIVWGQNIRIVIIPSFLAITYLGRSNYPH
jgi:hypothetical protein